MTRYLCDRRRHLLCEPYSVAALHRMADALGIHRRWFHPGKRPHYDIPKRRIAEIMAKCEIVTPREILRIIKASDREFQLELDRAFGPKEESHVQN